MTKTDSEG